MSVKETVKMPVQGVCTSCGYVASNAICKACVLLEGLNRGRPKLAVGKSSKALAELLAERLQIEEKPVGPKNIEDQF